MSVVTGLEHASPPPAIGVPFSLHIHDGAAALAHHAHSGAEIIQSSRCATFWVVEPVRHAVECMIVTLLCHSTTTVSASLLALGGHLLFVANEALE